MPLRRAGSVRAASPDHPTLPPHRTRRAAFSHRDANQEKGGLAGIRTARGGLEAGGSALSELGDAAAGEDHLDLPRREVVAGPDGGAAVEVAEDHRAAVA